MYLEHFNLESDPFRLSPDAKFFYPSLSHATAKEYMDYVLWSRDSFVVITGDIGTGKTTLIQKLLEDVGPKLTVAKIHQTQLDEIEFIQALLDQFGINPFRTESKVELLSMLNKFLQKKYEEGETVVVIIDEAQNLKPRVLEEIRLLSGFDSNREKLLNIFLVGQPELRDTLKAPQMEQLVQRIRLSFHLEGLGFDEVRSYIRHRLAIASRARFYPEPASRKLLEYQPSDAPFAVSIDIFPDEVISTILEYTGGIPRLINTLCDTALLTAFASGQRIVTKENMLAAIEELQWIPYKERASYRDSKAATVSKYKLKVCKNGIEMSTESINKDRILVGRSHLCDIKIDQKSVSGKHFELALGEKGYVLKDLGSTNHTFVNGKQVNQKNLKNGDLIEIGRYTFEYIEDEPSSMDEQVYKLKSDVSIPPPPKQAKAKQSLLDKLNH